MLQKITLIYLVIAFIALTGVSSQSCSNKCRLDCDCYDNTLCVNGECVQPNNAILCETNADCTSGRCRNGICLKKPGQACTDSSECDTSRCAYGSCQGGFGNACTSHSNCSYNFLCDTAAGVCKGKAGEKCRCNGDCLGGYCKNDRTCGVPLDGFCLSDDVCDTNTLCHPTIKQCKGKGNSACTIATRDVCYSRTCSIYNLCGTPVTYQTCTTNANCPYSFLCTNGVCLAPPGYGCRANSECAGNVCDATTGTCGITLSNTGCTADVQCNANLVCTASGACLGRSNYVCQSNSVCASGVCSIYNYCS